jgi:acyl carrier protein
MTSTQFWDNDRMVISDYDALETTLHDYLVKLAASRGKGIRDISRTDRLIEHGIFDSLSLLDFVMFTEKASGLKIPGEDVHPENFGSLEAVMLYLRERA